MHILVGQDTDSESNPLEAAMPWIVKLDKDDFVGKWSIEQVARAGSQVDARRLRDAPTGALPLEGGQVVVDGVSAGRVTSVRCSEQLDKVIGMAVVPLELAEDGTTLDIKIDGTIEQAIVHDEAVLRPRGSTPPVVSHRRPHFVRAGYIRPLPLPGSPPPRDATSTSSPPTAPATSSASARS